MLVFIRFYNTTAPVRSSAFCVALETMEGMDWRCIECFAKKNIPVHYLNINWEWILLRITV